jgi:hypothetical protein
VLQIYTTLVNRNTFSLVVDVMFKCAEQAQVHTVQFETNIREYPNTRKMCNSTLGATVNSVNYRKTLCRQNDCSIRLCIIKVDLKLFCSLKVLSS